MKMPVTTIKLSELLANSGNLVTVFAKILSNPDNDKYMISDESAVKLLIVDPTFRDSKSLVIGNSIKIHKARIENGKDALIADTNTFIFKTLKQINVVQEEVLTVPKEQVKIGNYQNKILLALVNIELISILFLGNP